MTELVVEINTFFGGFDEIELNPEGVIDGDVVEAFTCGHCHSFALALQDAIPSLELVGVDWEYPDDEYEDQLPNHVLCRDRAGRLWDVNGESREGGAVTLAREDVESAFDGNYHAAKPEVATLFIAAWLEAHGEKVRR